MVDNRIFGSLPKSCRVVDFCQRPMACNGSHHWFVVLADGGHKADSIAADWSGSAKVARPTDSDQSFVRIGHCKLIRTPRFVFRSVPNDFAPECGGPGVHILHIKIKAERISATDEPALHCSREMKSPMAV